MSNVDTSNGHGTMDFDPSLFGVQGVPGNTDEVANQGQDDAEDPRSPAFTNKMVEFLESQLTGDEGAPGVKPDDDVVVPPDNAPVTQPTEDETLTEQQLDAIEQLTASENQVEDATVTSPDPTLVDGGGGADHSANIDLNALAQQVYGRPLSEEEAVNFMLFSRDIERLNPQQRQALQEQLYGGGNANQQQYTQPQPQPSAPQTQQSYPTTAVPAPVLPQDLDPEIAAALNPIISQMAAVQQQNQVLTQYVLGQEQTNIQNQTAQIQRQYVATKDKWFEDHPFFTPEEKAGIEVKLRSTNILPSQFQAYNQDAEAAMNATLDQMFWTDPQLRQRAVEQEAKKTRVADAQQAKKQRTSTALAGPGGAPQKPATNTQTGDGRDPIAEFVDKLYNT